MLKLHIFDNNTHNYYIDDVVKNIQQDEKLTNGLESSSDIWKVTLPHNYEHSLDIIQADDLQAILYDEDENHVITPFFTGYVTTSFNYAVDSHGQQSVQVSLEDKATHLLKTPYSKDESVVIKGKFSSKTTGDLGVVQKICNACGLTWTSNIYDISTQVEAIAEDGETCESLLKSVCKEMGYAYTTNANGQIYLIPLSTDSSISTIPVIHDIEMYDSINLTRRARSYRGSRIKWTELADRNNALIYRVTEGQSTIYPDCYVTITNGGTLPSTDGGYTYYDAIDLKNGSKIFSISNVVPDIHCPSGDGSVDYTTSPNCFVKYGAKSLKMLITATASGHIDRMQATADIRYVASENVTYGDGNLSTENLHEEDCRWIHDDSTSNGKPATKYANFIAQYDRYCSNTFTFKTKNNYNLGDIIKLDENVYVGFWNYIMITRKTRTLVDYDESNKTFSGVWSYEAVSTDQFNYTQQVTNETQSAPPSTTYTQTLPDLSDVASLQLYTDKSFLIKDLRSTLTQTMTIKAAVTGGLTPTLSSASYSDGTVIDIYSDRTHSNIPRIQPTSNNDGWELICYENKDAESISITGEAGTLTNTIGISLNDQTQYYKFLGNYASDSAAQSSQTVLVGDFYTRTNNGVTYECTAKSGSSYTWGILNATNAANAEKLLRALESATRAGIQLETMSNPNTVSWFNTILSAKAVIDSLFSRYITILNGGSIHSEYYNDDGTINASSTAGKGFWLGANGELKCYSADLENASAKNITITGDSAFHGKFDCDVIRTEAENPSSYYDTTNGSVADISQAKRIADQLILEGLIDDYSTTWNESPLLPASIIGVSSNVAYVRVNKLYNSRYNYYTVSIYFYNSSMTELNIRNIVPCTTVGGSSGNSLLYNGQNNRGQYATNGINLRIYTGQDRLWVDVPDVNSASVLSSGMLFRAATATTISGIQGYPLYVKA